MLRLHRVPCFIIGKLSQPRWGFSSHLQRSAHAHLQFTWPTPSTETVYIAVLYRWFLPTLHMLYCLHFTHIYYQLMSILRPIVFYTLCRLLKKHRTEQSVFEMEKSFLSFSHSDTEKWPDVAWKVRHTHTHTNTHTYAHTHRVIFFIRGLAHIVPGSLAPLCVSMGRLTRQSPVLSNQTRLTRLCGIWAHTDTQTHTHTHRQTAS